MIVPFRQQAISFWGKQSKPQQITLVVLIVAALITIPILLTWASTPSYAVVFSGLTETDAGQIVEKLKASSIPYQLQNASTVLVPTSQVYEVRLMMASQGIPKNSTVGFEVFDSNTLGMTEFTQKVNYQRALEGELEKTISSLDAVETVRVHIVTPEKSLFSNEQQAATASVTLKIRAGRQINTAQVNAITHLVANSVANMKAENVVLVDTNGKMLTNNTQDNSLLNSLTQADSQRQIEQQVAQGIQQKVQTMLDNVLGVGHSTVRANVLIDWTQRETTSQTFNPTASAIRSSQKLNESYVLNGTTSGVPGAVSNLPTPLPVSTATAGNTLYTKNEETINYEVTQTQTKEVLSTGQLKHISVSVMVDNIQDAAIMTGLKNAVVAAAGIETTRGDTVAVESMIFDRTVATAQTEAEAAATQNDLYIRLAQLAAAVIGGLILLFMIMQLFSKLRKSASEQWRPVMRPVSELALSGGYPAGYPVGGLTAAYAGGAAGTGMLAAGAAGEGLPAAALPQGAEGIAAVQQQVTSRLQEMSSRATVSAEDEQLQKMMGTITEDNPATVAEIIQMWLNEG